MKKLSLLIIGLLFIPTFFLTSCDDGDDPVVVEPAFSILKDYMVTNGYDIPQIIKNSDGEKFVTGAPATATDVPTWAAKYHIIDIRNSDSFNAGHIVGAKNVAFSDILAEGAAATKPVLVVCYTGQTACYATALMRMYGFKHTQALKWGMSSWSEETAGAWNSKKGASVANGHSNWSYGNAPNNMVFNDPAFASLKTDGAALLKERVEQAVAGGFKTASGSDVLNSPQNYHINNFFSEADYTAFGHIDGAYRILPLSLADNSYLGLDPTSGAKVTTYCYTGQTSAVITACLRVLGYDAYSLTFGMNGMYNTNDAWSSNQWGTSPNVAKDLPLIK